MRYRSLLGALLLTGAVLPVVSCSTSPSLTSIVISPSSYTTTLVLTASGASAPTTQQGQTLYTATGYYTHPGHPAATKDLTNEVNWLSYTPELVTVATNGVATVTGGAIGTTQVTASMPGFNGDVISTPSTFTVTLPTATKTSDVTTIVVTPADPIILQGQSAGFSAIGTTGNGGTENLTNQSVWTSSNPNVCAINAATGNCASTALGTAAITATYTNPDGIEVTGYTVLSVQVLGQQ
jgi:trimeric autotransporter adhesin